MPVIMTLFESLFCSIQFSLDFSSVFSFLPPRLEVSAGVSWLVIFEVIVPGSKFDLFDSLSRFLALVEFIGLFRCLGCGLLLDLLI